MRCLRPACPASVWLKPRHARGIDSESWACKFHCDVHHLIGLFVGDPEVVGDVRDDIAGAGASEPTRECPLKMNYSTEGWPKASG
jgi:hypothetical protein